MDNHNKLHSQGKVGWKMSVGKEFDWTDDEHHNNRGLLPENEDFKEEPMSRRTSRIISQRNAPASWNWVEQGHVTAVKSQAKKSKDIILVIYFSFKGTMWQLCCFCYNGSPRNMFFNKNGSVSPVRRNATIIL